jgi:3',5'-cyclic AMP phosphodiesterase CpdA
MVGFRRQTVSIATHWKGPPKDVEAYRPLEPAAPLRIAVIGDAGDSGKRLSANAAAMAEVDSIQPFDDLLLLGDNVYPDGDPARLGATVFEPFAPLLDRGVGLLAVLGNHDVIGDHGDDQMAALGMEGRWWSRRLGDVLLVGLDSNRVDDPEQRAWLEETLAATDAPWRIVAVHHPPYSAGYQGSNERVRRVFGPLFERYGVQLVLSGHDHDYQRSHPIRGVTYVVAGAGSGTRRTGEAEFTANSFAWLHFVEVSVWPDRLVLRPVGGDPRRLEIADEWELTR